MISGPFTNTLFFVKNSVSHDDLGVFLTVVREGGFRAAARRLGLAPSKVSTTITRIETELGVPLLIRTTRSVRTTEAGQALAERIAPHLAGLDAARGEIADAAGRVRGRLKLNAPGAVMPDILPRLLATLTARHPAVETEIVVENRLVDIVAAGCDAGIRYGDFVAKDMVSIPIGPRTQQIALAAAPQYLEARGTPADPEDLALHEAIRYRLPDGPFLPWTLRDGAGTISVQPVTRLVLSVDALDTGRAYARAGIGIIGAFRNWLEEDFANGLLVPVLPDRWCDMEGPRLYYPSRFGSAALRAFVEICRDASGR
ncbi:LysR family transcriptional regulator [Allosediminivita pacifica]|uniref:LysR family transcriptional regulator n=1 Tax=Allosediminivita pacifica TaxID=1267769 RepID=A0A2T6AZU0_9RHOB|nr:LysR family transcriptional regulator [Allosediminivita pacifica]